MLQTASCPSCGARGEEQPPTLQKCLLPVDTSAVLSPSSSLVTQEDNPSLFFSHVIIFLLIRFTRIHPVPPQPQRGPWWCQAGVNNPAHVLGWDGALAGEGSFLCCQLTGPTVCPMPSPLLTTSLLAGGLLALETALEFSP